MMPALLAGATLTLVAMAIVYLACRPGRTVVADDAWDAQVAVFRQRRGELDRDLAQGLIDEEQHGQLLIELERQLLDESNEPAPPSAGVRFGHWPVLAMALAIPLGSYWLYTQYGAADEWRVHQVERELAAKERWTVEDVARLQAVLDAALEEQPNDAALLYRRARLGVEAGEYADAAAFYRRLAEQMPADADVLAQWAQAIYLAGNSQLTPEVRRLLDQALAIRPSQVTALGMLGVDAYQRGEFVAAIDYWTRLKQAVGPFSPQGQMVEGGIQRAREQAEASGELPTDGVESAAQASLQIEVALAPELRQQVEGVLYIYARGNDGVPLPVAVARLPAGNDWPKRVTLSDANAMSPQRKLSQFEEVTLRARISRQGDVAAKSGDWEGDPVTVEVASADKPVRIVIDRVIP